MDGYERSLIVGDLMSKAGMSSGEDTTKDLRPYRIQRDKTDIANIIARIESTMNPFILENENNLYCLTSGRKLDDSVKKEILSYREKGDQGSEAFRDACFSDPLNFEKPIKRRKVDNFASAAVKKTTVSKIKQNQIQGTRDLFGRLLIISTMAKIYLEKVLEFPLTVFPLSLAHADGSMNTTDKAKLMQKLENMVSDEIA